MHTGGLCFFTGASLFIVGVVGYFFTGPNNKGVYLLSSFVFFVVNVISVCMLPDNFLFLCGAVMNQCAVPCRCNGCTAGYSPVQDVPAWPFWRSW